VRTAVLLSLFAVRAIAQNPQPEILAPYYETPQSIVERMLALAGLKPGENMFDLGSGDGRIVITAAQKYKANATGVELDPALVKRSRARINHLRLSSGARIIEGDLLRQDYSSADVVTVFLLPIANEKLIPLLEKQLKSGARVVSHNTAFAPWVPAKVETIDDDGEGHSHKLYLYQR